MSNRRGTVADLGGIIAALPEAERLRLERIFLVTTDEARVVVPRPMVSFVESEFGSLEAVTRQRIVKVTNLITLEGTIYNALRASRPEEVPKSDDEIFGAQRCEDDPFSEPLSHTTEHTFGRVRGTHSVTAANLVPFERLHSVIIFDRQNPLAFTEEALTDAIDTALAWARVAHSQDAEARYFFLFWNCLWRAGASRIHGHMQATLGRGMHHAQVEHQRRSALLYSVGHGTNYFDDLVAVHRSLSLAVPLGNVDVLAYLAARKEKETWVMAPLLDEEFKHALFQVLHAHVHEMGVQSFNMALLWKPIDTVVEDWSGFPVIARIVDRGALDSRVSDIAAMELFGSSVVSSDPMQVARVLQGALK